ncbi:hypothetical protein KA005_53590, partial [bacterium]|nr:hypothetical protein [bacterium]
SNRSVALRTPPGKAFYLKPDFQLSNNAIIEYWSPEDKRDSQNKSKAYTKYRDIITQELRALEDRTASDPRLSPIQREEIIRNYLLQKGISVEFGPRSSHVEYTYDAFGRLIKKKSSRSINYYAGERDPPGGLLSGRYNYAIGKPNFLSDKKELLKRYAKPGGKVYYVAAQTMANKASIESEVSKILEEIEANWVLSESKAKELISKYLAEKGIAHLRNPELRIEARQIQSDFLLLNWKIFIEYWSGKTSARNRRNKEVIYKTYEAKGGKVCFIEAGNKKKIVGKLDEIISTLPKSTLTNENISDITQILSSRLGRLLSKYLKKQPDSTSRKSEGSYPPRSSDANDTPR